MESNFQSALFQNYKERDRKLNVYSNFSYKYLVNFSQTKELPIHRWFYYQEGYSPKLVKNILKHLGLLTKKKILVFDPFAGSGTTLLTSKQLGFKASGFEINPFSAFMIRVKTRNYSEEDLKQYSNFKIPEYKKMKDSYSKYDLSIIKKLFDEQKLEKIEILKEAIGKVSNEKVKDLLVATLLSILESVSYYRKAGNGLKRKRVHKDLDPFIEFQKKREEILLDLIAKTSNNAEPLIINDSCLNLGKYDINEIDISIFSPPYANCFDPFEVYKIELWIGEFINGYADLKGKRKNALTSNLNANLNKEFNSEHRTDLLEQILRVLSKKVLWDKRIVKMLDTYFYDMYIVLNEIFNKTKEKGYCVIVVGNSSYGNITVPTDIILAEIGEKIGFKTKEIIVGRTNEASSQQHAKLGSFKYYVRESIVILQK
ncbi:modification methylase [Candidatus Woesearchaeota archaeon]|nr:modification methylase [Candidatus Woesearchaeota archaeon]